MFLLRPQISQLLSVMQLTLIASNSPEKLRLISWQLVC